MPGNRARDRAGPVRHAADGRAGNDPLLGRPLALYDVIRDDGRQAAMDRYRLSHFGKMTNGWPK